MRNVVTLYDMMYDLAARKLTIPTNEALYTTGALKGLAAVSKEFKTAGAPILSSYQPDFTTEIYPILYAAATSMWLFNPAFGHHIAPLFDWNKLARKNASYANDRHAVFIWVRQPDASLNNSFPYMPKLLGDEPYKLAAGVIHNSVRLTLTPTQYAILQQWEKGNFIEPAVIPPTRPSTTSVSPEGLDRAALENCVGGAFFPGIEAGWQTRSDSIYREPFRVVLASQLIARRSIMQYATSHKMLA